MRTISVVVLMLFFGIGHLFSQTSDTSTVIAELSPNGDGVNDVFNIESRNLSTMTTEIYDTNANLILKSEKLNFEWDGKKIDGTNAKEGTYLYRVNAEGVDEKKYGQMGKVNLKR